MLRTKKIITVALVLLVAGLSGISGYFIFLERDREPGPNGNYETHEDLKDLQTFSSYEGIEEFLKTNNDLGHSGSYRYLDSSGYYGWQTGSNSTYREVAEDGSGAPAEKASGVGDDDTGGDGGSADHSETNVQEEGVDEGDIVKNDGEYAYVVSGDMSRVIISDVYPAEGSEIVSEIEVGGSVIEIYLVGDCLVVLGRKGGYYGYHYGWERSRSSSGPVTFVEVYDVGNREEPVLIRNDTVRGSYVSSRMIGGYFYLIGRQYTWQVENENQLAVPPSEVFYVDGYDHSYSYTNIVSINVRNALGRPEMETILMGSSSEVYVSLNNIYLTYGKRLSWVERKEMEMERVVVPLLPERNGKLVEAVTGSGRPTGEKMREMDEVMGQYIGNLTETEREEFYNEWREEKYEFLDDIASELERTVIYRVSIREGKAAFRARGEVPGYILNRFSMGEHDDHFRIATTTGHVSRTGTGTAKNHLYVLDMDLNITGAVRDIAPGERIYSARFMGERAYLVTFDKVDPFFVIDLGDPYDPVILGELKIPGYSDYLHPYDENHVIGLGKETVLAESGSFSWYQGVKLSLFEVTDVNNPKEISKYVIGDRGTYSPAQRDPHAFLFSRNKELLVLPIRLYEVDHSEYSGRAPPYAHGDFVWQGVYVFHISSDDGFVLTGRIGHSDNEYVREDSYYYGNNDESVKRSFYIDDVLYTVSNRMIKANDMDSLVEIARVEFPREEY